MATSQTSIATVSSQPDSAFYTIEMNIVGDKWMRSYWTDFPEHCQPGVFVTRAMVDVALDLATNQVPDREFRIVSDKELEMRRDDALAKLLALTDEHARGEAKKLADEYSRLSEHLSIRYFADCCFETE
jgi:hypothetical protein